MNILDYLEWRGDIPMDVCPFNEVDNMILCQMAYLDWDEVLAADFNFDQTIKQAYISYQLKRIMPDTEELTPYLVLRKAAESPRFQNIKLSGFFNEFDEANVIQLAALTYKLDDHTIYIAYRGTDQTLTGWHEDFNFGYLSETPGQAKAVDYLEKAIRETGCKAYVGGHSKGGNFAVYASAFAHEDIRKDWIINIFSNDGPGFKETIAESENYNSVLDKIIKIVPEGSIIGMLLFGKEDYRIAKAEGKGFEQHSMFNWHVKKDSIEAAEELTYLSNMINTVFDQWVMSLEDEQRKTVISSVFEALEGAGYSSLGEIFSTNKLTAYNAISKAAKNIDVEERKSAGTSLKAFVSFGKDKLLGDAKKKLNRE